MYIEDKPWGEEGGLEEMHLKCPVAPLFKKINFWKTYFFLSWTLLISFMCYKPHHIFHVVLTFDRWGYLLMEKLLCGTPVVSLPSCKTKVWWVSGTSSLTLWGRHLAVSRAWIGLGPFFMILSVYRSLCLRGNPAETQKILLTILIFGNKSRYLHVSICGFMDSCQVLDRTVDFWI